MTKEQFEYWKSLPETQEIFKAIHEEVARLTQHIAMGGTVSYDSVDRTAIQTAGYSGRIQGVSELINMDSELNFGKEDE